MSDEKLTRIENKIDSLFKQQSDMKVAIAGWPKAMTKIDENSTKIVALEVDLAKLKTLVFVWGSILSIAVPSVITLITMYLQKPVQ